MSDRHSPGRLRVLAGLAGLAMVLALIPAISGMAQTTRGGGDVGARVQAVMQQLASEKAAMQADINRLKEQIAGLEKKLAKLQAENQSLSANVQRGEGEIAAARAARDRMTEGAQATEERMKELVAKYRELAENFRKVEAERNGLAAGLKARTQDLGTCSKANAELAGIAGEALDRYEKKGCFGALAQSEPFTQIGRARVKNIVEANQQKIEALKIPASAGDAPPEATPAATP